MLIEVAEVQIEIERQHEHNVSQFKKGLISLDTLTARDSALLGLKSSLDSLPEVSEKELCSYVWWEDRGWLMIPPSVTLEGIESLLAQIKKAKEQRGEANGASLPSGLDKKSLEIAFRQYMSKWEEQFDYEVIPMPLFNIFEAGVKYATNLFFNTSKIKGFVNLDSEANWVFYNEDIHFFLPEDFDMLNYNGEPIEVELILSRV